MKRREYAKSLRDKKLEQGIEVPVVQPPPADKILFRRNWPAPVNQRKGHKNVPRITRQDLKALLQSNSGVVLVDLRDSDFGEPMIPTAVKFPLPRTRDERPMFRGDEKKMATKEQQINALKEAFRLTEEQFEAKYKWPRFTKDQQIVFYSSTGIRSDTIAEVVSQWGYNAKSLLGGSRLWNKFHSTPVESKLNRGTLVEPKLNQAPPATTVGEINVNSQA